MDITFGNRFKELRLEKDKNQQQLVDEFNKLFHYNFTRVSVSQYENGKRMPEIDALKAFSDYFGVSVDYLLGRSDIRTTPSSEKEKLSPEVETIAAHLDDKELTPHKVKMIKRYIDDLFDEEF